ncbi:uncharacterized protein LOC129791330 isoform X1 [Lutzomyia longipalpis]|uniref:uncharacterized protein LOC129791330 isoform X1 n=1 Tax=Lutzomyia longipalpis TaxID=7200 RepID=UPI002483B47E|nr:uncharacterized protein LOC129791330 isoform X1 [Lutzomyia longipalpis]
MSVVGNLGGAGGNLCCAGAPAAGASDFSSQVDSAWEEPSAQRESREAYPSGYGSLVTSVTRTREGAVRHKKTNLTKPMTNLTKSSANDASAKHFRIINPEVFVRGSFSQDNIDLFGGFANNKQSMANSVVAIAYAHVLDPSYWTSTTIDEILCQGNEVYISARENTSEIYLISEEIRKDFTIMSKNITLDYAIDDLALDLHGELCGKHEFGNLHVKLIAFFERYTHGVITCGDLSVAVLKTSNMFYMFDSHSRGSLGKFVAKDGTSVLCGYSNVSDLHGILMYNLSQGDINYKGTKMFTVTAYKVVPNHTEVTLKISELTPLCESVQHQELEDDNNELNRENDVCLEQFGTSEPTAASDFWITRAQKKNAYVKKILKFKRKLKRMHEKRMRRDLLHREDKYFEDMSNEEVKEESTSKSLPELKNKSFAVMSKKQNDDFSVIQTGGGFVKKSKQTRQVSFYKQFGIVVPNVFICGSYSQDNEALFGSDSNNKQCTACAVVALAYTHVIPVSSWKSDTLNEILLKGNDIYNISQQFYEYLSVNQVCNEFEILDTKVNIELVELFKGDEFNPLAIGLQGEIKGKNGHNSLESALQHFFEHFNCGVFTSGSVSVAIFKANDLYYYFDSHSRGAFGQFVQEKGTSILCGYADFISLLNILKYNFLYGNLEYEDERFFSITPIYIKTCKIRDDIKSEDSVPHLVNEYEESNIQSLNVNQQGSEINNQFLKLNTILQNKKAYKKQLRKTSRVYRTRENENRKRRHIEERNDDVKRQMENEARKQRLREERKDDVKRQTENAIRKKRLREERKDDVKRQMENEARKKRLREERKDDVKRQTENTARKKRLREERKDDAKKQTENQARKIRHIKERKDEVKRQIENDKRRQRHIIERKDPAVRRKENISRKIRMQKKSKSLNTKKFPKLITKRSKNLKSRNIQIRFVKKIRKSQKSNILDRKSEKSIKLKYANVDQSTFENQLMMFRDRLQRSLKIKSNYNYKKFKGTNMKKRVKRLQDKSRTLLEFFEKRKEVPEFICGCCECIFFKHSVRKLKIDKCKYSNKSDLEDFLKISDYCCNTCLYSLNKNKLPKLAVKNGLAFPEVPDCIKELSDLEERMVAPILNFMEIRELKKYMLNPQKGLKGSVVHVPVEINDMIKVLPRKPNEMKTLQIKLKRHEEYKNHYMFDTVRPWIIIEAINYLITKPLYKLEGISLDPNFIIDNVNNQEIPFIVDVNDYDSKNTENEITKTNIIEIIDEEVTEQVLDDSNFSKDRNFQDIRNSTTYVTNTHTDRFIEIINHNFAHNFMFQTNLIEERGLKWVTSKGRYKRNVQILFLKPTGNSKIGHWVTTLHENGSIKVYDSLHWNSLNNDCINFLKKMYPTTMKKSNVIIFMNTFQQNDTYSCGVHAIANSVALLNNIEPSNLCYQVGEMRNHLADMLDSGSISMFPTVYSMPTQVFLDVYDRPTQIIEQKTEIEEISEISVYDRPTQLIPTVYDQPTQKMSQILQYGDKNKNNSDKQENLEDIIDYGDCVPNEDIMAMDLNEYVTEASKIQIMAPGQGKKPIYASANKNLEFLSFPKIYCGEKYENENIYYYQQVKSEQLRRDRRCCTPTKVLYSCNKKLLQSVQSSINTALRKSKKTETTTASDVLSENKLSKLIENDDGFRYMKNISLTPGYLADKQNTLLAQIRQLGKPHFFITTTFSELHCPELLQNLAKNAGRELTLLESMNLEKAEKTLLIRNDPVTCVRYFTQKDNNLMSLLKIDPNKNYGTGKNIVQKCGPFEDNYVIDSFERYEFQMRGSVHSHKLVWLKDFPEFDEENTQFTEKYIRNVEKFMTCKYVDPEKYPLIKKQMHKHSETCYKGKRNMCRFNFPIPPMDRTEILIPFSKEERELHDVNALKEIYKRIYNEVKNFSIKFVDMSFEDFLFKLDITRQQYILAIRSVIKRPRMFLKRSSLEVNINAYNRDILNYTESNMDIQPVLEVNALVKYVADYVTKSDSGVTKILKDISTEIKVHKNYTLEERLRKYGNGFLNNKLVSAQEAAYYCLSIPITKSSRGSIYINTRPINERTRILKPKKDLLNLPEDSTDIFAQDIVHKYEKRKGLDNVSLIEYAADYTEVRRNNTDDRNVDEIEARERKYSKIVRYRGYLEKDGDNYYREQILLYLPFRNEKTEIEECDHQAKYFANLDAIKKSTG